MQFQRFYCIALAHYNLTNKNTICKDAEWSKKKYGLTAVEQNDKEHDIEFSLLVLD